MNVSPIENSEALCIGTVEFVSPDKIEVLLNVDAPESVSLNAGIPRPFPRVNGYVLVSNDEGYLVGQIEWITIERSAFPKRKGIRDFGLVDLPYPLRKMSLNPLGTLRKKVEQKGQVNFCFQRGADSFPSVGVNVLLPTQDQLRSIVESGENRRVKIGTSPLAGNAEVKVDPDRLFGRHLAVLGNTGSGKSCSVAGLIRWSLEAAQENNNKKPNARFIVLDPNGEYARAFANDKDILRPRIFKVDTSNSETSLHVPLWFWNSSEWFSFSQATEKTQKPILRQALRLRRNRKRASEHDTVKEDLLNYLNGVLDNIKQQMSCNAPFASLKEGKYWGFLEILIASNSSLKTFKEKSDEIVGIVDPIIGCIEQLINIKCKNERGFNKPFEYGDIDYLLNEITSAVNNMGGCPEISIPLNEDTPIPFSEDDLLLDLNFLATNSGNRQWFEFFMMRIHIMLSDTLIKCISEMGTITLKKWLTDYIGANNAENGNLTIIDLSLVPPEIIHIITAVIARMVFEALQRYRKLDNESRVLPTTLVMEEAHTFVKSYKVSTENQDSASVCCQVFERIAREGRKFGLGLVLSSQRPSELSPTVLSQCNSFLLHRISNDKDQDLVHRFVPDNLKGLFRELPSLPSQNAILLGWASELPILVRINDLPKDQQPKSDDPDFWSVWIGDNERKVDWEKIADDWQERKNDIQEDNSTGR